MARTTTHHTPPAARRTTTAGAAPTTTTAARRTTTAGAGPVAHTTARRHLKRAAASALLGAGLAAALGAAPAAADSIAYIKGGNVWLTTTDGSRQYQVTTDGGYSTVSQSDLGKMVALRGDKLVVFNPDGSPVHVNGTKRYEYRTPHSYTMPGTSFRGPFDPAISPDGMKIAYTWYYTQYGETPNCNPSNGCQTVYGRQGTNYLSPDGQSPYDKPGWKEQTGWVGPSWNADGETLLSDPIQVGNPDAVIHTPGDEASGLPGGLSPWFFDPSATGGLADGELSRDKSKLVFVTGDAHETLFLYRGKGGYPAVPENCYRLNDGQGRISSPSWSPDGTTLAYADAAGVYVLPLPSFASDCGTPTDAHTKRLLIAGASNPDWGAANVPPARQGDSGGGGNDGQSGGGQPDPAPDTAKPPRGPAITIDARPKLGAALRRGLTVQLSGLKKGRITVKATASGKPVASGTVTVPSSGRAKVTLRFTTTARKQLGRRASVKLTLRAGTLRTPLTLKR